MTASVAAQKGSLEGNKTLPPPVATSKVDMDVSLPGIPGLEAPRERTLTVNFIQ